MRLIAFIMESPVVEKILLHIGELTKPPAVLPARTPPQTRIGFDKFVEANKWPDMVKTADIAGETWN